MHVIALIVALTVTGQTTQSAQQPSETIKYKKIQVVNFSDDAIEGTREVPAGLVVEGRKPPTFHSLVKVRDNFNDKLLASVHEM